MADQLERVAVAASAVTISTVVAVGQRPREVAHAPVVVGRPVALLRLAVEDADGQRRAREAGADRGGGVGAGGAVGEFAG